MLRPLSYLAGPYSHADESVKEARYEHLTKASAWLMRVHGWNVFSPITHSHPLHKIGGMRGDWAFWQQVDTEYLAVSCRMLILTLPGWQDSVGVTAETKIAKGMGLEVLYIIPQGPDNYIISATPEPTNFPTDLSDDY